MFAYTVSKNTDLILWIKSLNFQNIFQFLLKQFYFRWQKVLGIERLKCWPHIWTTLLIKIAHTLWQKMKMRSRLSFSQECKFGSLQQSSALGCKNGRERKEETTQMNTMNSSRAWQICGGGTSENERSDSLKLINTNYFSLI